MRGFAPSEFDTSPEREETRRSNEIQRDLPLKCGAKIPVIPLEFHRFWFQNCNAR